MNKNSKSRLKLAIREYKKGNKTSVFAIPQTMSGAKSLGSRNLTLTIGECARKTKTPKVAGKNAPKQTQED